MTQAHANTRLEAFCDGVFAIALTLLIIEIHPPAPESIKTTSDLWHALQHLAPQAFAFVLSFGTILIAWVNHHATLKLVNSSSATFIYANGFLLLTVVIVPFPTALLGEYIWTDHAAPAVVLYNAVLAVQGIGWVLMGTAALKGKLISDVNTISAMRINIRNGYFAFGLYCLFSVAALWFPLAVAILTSATFVFWLVFGLRMKHA